MVLPQRIGKWSLMSLASLQQRLVKHARYYWLLLAQSHLTRRLFGAMAPLGPSVMNIWNIVLQSERARRILLLTEVPKWKFRIGSTNTADHVCGATGHSRFPSCWCSWPSPLPKRRPRVTFPFFN
jgi:hypothetical protein